MVENVVGNKMVVGFMFAGGASSVLLVCKLRPDWQRGLWNGVGGVMERDETPVQAMMREFQEETNYETTAEDWRHFATEVGPFGSYAYFFSSTLKSHHRSSWPSHNDAGEKLMWRGVNDVVCSSMVLGNLHWLVPLALDPRGFRVPVLIEPSGYIRERASW